MRGLIFVAIVIALVCAGICLYVWWNNYTTAKGAAKAAPQGVDKWVVGLFEANAHPITSVFLTDGNRKEFWTSINRLDDDYEQKLYDAQAAAQDECDERNVFERSLNA